RYGAHAIIRRNGDYFVRVISAAGISVLTRECIDRDHVTATTASPKGSNHAIPRRGQRANFDIIAAIGRRYWTVWIMRCDGVCIIADEQDLNDEGFGGARNSFIGNAESFGERIRSRF